MDKEPLDIYTIWTMRIKRLAELWVMESTPEGRAYFRKTPRDGFCADQAAAIFAELERKGITD